MTRQRLHQLRHHLQRSGLEAIWIPSADAHLNEYLPIPWQRRQWLTGFTGSAGEALVALDRAWLAVDSRYHEQVEQQVDSEVFQILKLGITGQRTLYGVIEELGQGHRLGVDPFTISVAGFQELREHCDLAGVELVCMSSNGIDQVRQELEPQVSPVGDQPVFGIPTETTGASIGEKLTQVREQMAKRRIQVLPITKLDQIAWVFNLRGSDIPYNPVFIAYALISTAGAVLLTHPDRLDPEARSMLQEAGVEVEAYAQYPEQLTTWADTYGIVGIAPQHTTQGTVMILGSRPHRELKPHPIETLKAKKNDIELEGMRQANRRASRAKIRTLAWLNRQQLQGVTVTEADVAQQMQLHYQQEPGWHGLSFNTIAGAGANSSIVHYDTPDSGQPIPWGSLVLLDSGSQFQGGTTDDTRTVIWGDPTDLQRQRYTLVLQAHIQCASQPFPTDTPGTQLDGITRAALWRAGLDYGHGTGHGVGAFLNVHEGPIGISKRSHTPLEPGMITSIEPGFYEPGWGGIRVENLCEVQAIPEQAGWLKFEPLTWIPFDRRLVDESLLSAEQQQWLQHYHRRVYEMFMTDLSPEEAEWLRSACGQGSDETS